MGVRVLIPETFQTATGGVEEVMVEGETVGQCLNKAVEKYPRLQKLWFVEKDTLAHYLLIFVNGENIHGDSLKHVVKDGDEIYPMLIIGGG